MQFDDLMKHELWEYMFSFPRFRDSREDVFALFTNLKENSHNHWIANPVSFFKWIMLGGRFGDSGKKIMQFCLSISGYNVALEFDAILGYLDLANRRKAYEIMMKRFPV